MDIGQIHRREYESDAEQIGQPVIARSPARVQLLGEHGDTKSGLCLSSSINKYLYIAVSPRRDNALRFFATDYDEKSSERKRSSITNLKYRREDRWSNHIKAALQVFAALGKVSKGLNITVCSEIPRHIGLASSAAMEVAAAVAFRALFNVPMSDRELMGRLLREREAYFGKAASFVDYAVLLSAQDDSFVIVDEHTKEARAVQVALDLHKILIIDSRVPKIGYEEQELKQRRHDVRRGFETVFPNTDVKEITSKLLAAANLNEILSILPETTRRRTLFVIQDMKRVLEAESVLAMNDWQAFARMIYHSHEGLRDLYEVSCPETDWLVKRAQETEGVVGSRMTGLGFGGCTFAVIRESSIEYYKHRLEDYERIFGFHPIIYEAVPAMGAMLIAGAAPTAEDGV